MIYENRIAKIRRQRGMSQTALADAIGSTLSMVGKLERGDRELKSSWIAKISNALGCHPTDLFREEDEIVTVGTVMPDGTGEIILGRNAIPALADEDNRGFSPAQGPNLSSLNLMDGAVAVTIPIGARFVFSLRGLRAKPTPGALHLVTLKRKKGEGRLIKIGVVMPGTRPDSYHLIPLGGAIMQDVEFIDVAPITQIILR